MRVTPRECAEQFLRSARPASDIIPGYKNVEREILVYLYWSLALHLEGAEPEWIENLDYEIQKHLGGMSRDEFFERLSAYHEASSNDSGGGPMWWITRAFDRFVTVEDRLDLDIIVPLSLELAAMAAGTKDFLKLP